MDNCKRGPLFAVNFVGNAVIPKLQNSTRKPGYSHHAYSSISSYIYRQYGPRDYGLSVYLCFNHKNHEHFAPRKLPAIQYFRNSSLRNYKLTLFRLIIIIASFLVNMSPCSRVKLILMKAPQAGADASWRCQS